MYSQLEKKRWIARRMWKRLKSHNAGCAEFRRPETSRATAQAPCCGKTLGKTIAETPAQRSSVISFAGESYLIGMEGQKPVRFTVL